jgi:hypothetical protein
MTASQPPTPKRTVWPGIGRGLTHEDLPKHLFTVAAMHARRALAAAEDPLDQLDRATSIGTAVELLAKAALALVSPTLIAEKDPKSLLLYSGIPTTPAHEAKTKLAIDCLLLLKHSHSVKFSLPTDSKVFSVRNLALHIGQVDATLFDEALNTMTRVNEEILDVVKTYDASLDRSTFWGTELLDHVDERLKGEREAKKLELEELKAAARRDYERLKQMDLSDAALTQLADRDPAIDDPVIASADYYPERPECPVCGFDGWLGYAVTDRGTAYVETDPMHDDAWYFVDLTVEAVQFVCVVCGLNLDADLIRLEGMDNVREITVEATQEEIDALEQYQIETYLEDLYRERPIK